MSWCFGVVCLIIRPVNSVDVVVLCLAWPLFADVCVYWLGLVWFTVILVVGLYGFVVKLIWCFGCVSAGWF